MNNLIDKIEALQLELETTILARQEVFNKRSDKWRESRKGNDHQEVTERLKDLHEETVENRQMLTLQSF